MLHDYQETLLATAGSFQSAYEDGIYESILEQFDCGVMLFSEENGLQFVNSMMCSILEAPRHTLTGQSLTELLFHHRLSRHKKKVMLRICRDFLHKKKIYHEFADEYGRYWQVKAVGRDGLDRHCLFIVKEISDYKRIEQTAYHNDNLATLGRLSASIAHEIRNPLTAIRGFIQLLRPHLLQLGKDEYAKIILAEIDRANDIIHEFLSSSKPSTPQVSATRVSVLLKEVILLTESEALMKGCQIHLHVPAPDIQVTIDVKQMKQVLINMIRNAMEAITANGDEQEGRIEIGAKAEGAEVRITIADNGKGMDRCTLNRLFNPFFTTKENGTGLGLSVSDKIIKNHGGRVSVSSQPNQGTQFVITLPLRQ